MHGGGLGGGGAGDGTGRVGGGLLEEAAGGRADGGAGTARVVGVHFWGGRFVWWRFCGEGMTWLLFCCCLNGC